MNESEEKSVKKSHSKLIKAIVATVVILAAAYYLVGMGFIGRFFPYTEINGIYCGLLTVDEVKERISDAYADYILTIAERDGTETVTGGDFDLHVVFDDTLDELLDSQKWYAWPRSFFDADVSEAGNALNWDEDALRSILDGLNCMDSDKMEEPADAYVGFNGEDAFEVIPETYGTHILPAVFYQAVDEAVAEAADELDLEEAGCYTSPDVTSDDSELIEACEKMNSLLSVTISYDMADLGEIPISKEDMSLWIMMGSDGEPFYSEEAITSFVADFAEEYDTKGKPHTLVTSWGPTVTVDTGTYGWQLNQEAEVAAIEEDLAAGEDVTREPVWSYTANSHSENDYGGTYVEVNLTAQHLYFYKDGELVVQSDFVSGDVARRRTTPTGVYPVTYTARNAVLHGEDYETPVSFWMPFNGGVGLHDATWRGSYGGSIYKTNGSHGCVNLPYSAAQIIYNNIKKGDCVIVYTLEGTETESSRGNSSVMTE